VNEYDSALVTVRIHLLVRETKVARTEPRWLEQRNGANLRWWKGTRSQSRSEWIRQTGVLGLFSRQRGGSRYEQAATSLPSMRISLPRNGQAHRRQTDDRAPQGQSHVVQT